MGGEPAASRPAELNSRTVIGVTACLIGQMLGSSLLTSAALPLLLLPITTQFGWTATAFSTAITFMMICGAISGPLIGRLIDHFGARRVILCGTVMVGLTTLGLTTTNRHIWLFYVAHALLGVFGTTALGYVKIIGGLFVQNRAKALAVFGVEAALAGSAAPLLIEAVLSAHGWRAVYLVLGGTILATVPVLFVMLPRTKTAEEIDDSAAGTTGIPPGEALRTGTMWLLIAAVVVGAAPRLGFMAYIVPFLDERGFQAASGASAIASVTISGLAGSLVAGILMDRFPTPLIAVPLQLLGMVSVFGLALLGNSTTSWAGLITVSALFGFTMQAHLPLMSYFLSRFFGLLHFGQIYGVAVAVVAIGIGLFTPAIGSIIENGLGYTGAIWIMTFGLMLSALLFLRLGTLQSRLSLY